MAGQSYHSNHTNTNYYYGNTINTLSYGSTFNAAYQGQGPFEERSCWRELYDYQSGYWYYQNLLTNTTQWEKPEGWDSWPTNGEETQTNDDGSHGSGLSIFRQTSNEIEIKNTEYGKREARRQIDPDEAKKIHWRPEGANEYNIWYDKWIGDHWKGTKDEGRLLGCCGLFTLVLINTVTFSSGHLLLTNFYFFHKYLF